MVVVVRCRCSLRYAHSTQAEGEQRHHHVKIQDQVDAKVDDDELASEKVSRQKQ